MLDLKLWSLEKNDKDKFTPAALDNLVQTETEQQLEELIVENPDLLFNGLKFVGRQTSTHTGALDLLGVDQDGHLVVFELKRGKLFREAVAQVIDYASFLAALDKDTLYKHIADRSGSFGIEKINDFEGWYQEKIGNDMEPLEDPPIMVLVGLGYDDATKRMVDFLSDNGVNISLITFYAFQKGDQTFLAKQVAVDLKESKTQKQEYTKANNQAILDALIQKTGVVDLFSLITNFLKENLPSAYIYPNRTCLSFSLPEKTELGKLSYRAYVALYVFEKQKKSVSLYFNKRCINQAGEVFEDFMDQNPGSIYDTYGNLPIKIKTTDNWEVIKTKILPLIRAVIKGWEDQVAEG